MQTSADAPVYGGSTSAGKHDPDGELWGPSLALLHLPSSSLCGISSPSSVTLPIICRTVFLDEHLDCGGLATTLEHGQLEEETPLA